MYKWIKHEINPEVREALGEIDKIISSLDYTPRGKVIDILSGLRGPDERGDNDIKGVTTTWVRTEALPLTADTGGGDRWNTEHTDRPMLQDDVMNAGLSHHFAKHFVNAMEALGWRVEWVTDDI